MNQTMLLSAVYSAIDKVSGPVKKMTSSVNSFGNSMNDNGKKMRDWGAKVGAMSVIANEGGNVIKRVVTDMGQPFFEVEKNIAGLERNIKSSGKNQAASMEAAITAAKSWEKVHKGSAASFIEMTDKMSAANFKEIDAIRGARHAITLATGTMSDNNTASELLIYSYQTLGDKTKSAADEMKKHADMTAKAQQIYSMRGLGEFTDAMKDAMPAAAAFRQKYEEAAVAVGTLQRAGWQGGKAGGSYASILGSMEKASSELGFTLVRSSSGALDFVSTIDKISNKYGDLRKITPDVRDKLKAAFGDDGIRMLMVFQQQSGQMKKAMDDLKNSTGEAAKARDTMENKGFGKMEKYLQRINAVKVNAAEKIFGSPQIMDKIIPAFISAIETIVNLGVSFANANPEITTFLLTITAIGAGMLLILAPMITVGSGFLTLSGIVISATGNIFTFLKAIASGQAITKAQAYIRLLNIRYIAFKGCVVQNIATMKTFGLRILATGKTAAVAGLQGIKSFTIGVFAMGKAAIVTAVTALPGLIAGVWAFTAALLANPMTWVVIGIMALIGAIALCIIYWDDISRTARAAWVVIKDSASAGMDFLMGRPGQYIDFLGGMYQMFFDAGARLWTTFADGIKSVISAPVELIKKGVALIDEYLPHSDARRGPLSRLTWSGQRLMTTFAAGIPKGYDALTKAMSGGMEKINLTKDFNPFPSPDDDNNGGPIGFGGVGGAGGAALSLAGNSGNHYHFHGPITIKAEKMDKPEDFAKALQIFVDESGG